MAVQCDFGVAEAVRALFAAFDRAFDRVDILINNVGIGSRFRPEELPLEEWRKVVRVNLEGTWVCTQETGRRMIRGGHGGSIVNISSIAGSSALGRGNFVYSVTKGGINQFTRELAVEWAPYGIRVNAIQPAQTMTQAMTRCPRSPTRSGDTHGAVCPGHSTRPDRPTGGYRPGGGLSRFRWRRLYHGPYLTR